MRLVACIRMWLQAAGNACNGSGVLYLGVYPRPSWAPEGGSTVKRVEEDGSVAVHLRLSHAAWLRYANDAAVLRKPLGTFLRERLERQDDHLQELQSLRGTLERLEASQAKPALHGEGGKAPADTPTAALLEVLLLLRGSTKVDQVRAVWAELERISVRRFQSGEAVGTKTP